MVNITPDYETITIEEFDNLARSKLFAEGPEIETVEHNDIYCPGREVRGTLLNGRKVRAVFVK